MENTYDLIIVGSGPAGFTAAIYAQRRALKTLMIAKQIGGQMGLTNEIENYPGFEFTSGVDLSMKMKAQAEKWGAKIELGEVEKIEKTKDGFLAKVSQKEFKAKAIILAFGLTPRSLEVPGEKELTGKGVSYCATCDGPLFKNKIVGVVGGGNSAVESVIYLSKLAKKVYLFHFSEKFNASPYLLERAKSLKNVEFYCCARVDEIKGDKILESVIVEDANDPKKKEEFKLDGLFVEIGYQPKTSWLKDTLKLNKRGEVEIDENNMTSLDGVFAAGDCSTTPYKQIVIAAGEGAKSALSAYKYIIAKDGGVVVPDWGKCELVGSDEKDDMEIAK